MKLMQVKHHYFQRKLYDATNSSHGNIKISKTLFLLMLTATLQLPGNVSPFNIEPTDSCVPIWDFKFPTRRHVYFSKLDVKL